MEGKSVGLSNGCFRNLILLNYFISWIFLGKTMEKVIAQDQMSHWENQYQKPGILIPGLEFLHFYSTLIWLFITKWIALFLKS